MNNPSRHVASCDDDDVGSSGVAVTGVTVPRMSGRSAAGLCAALLALVLFSESPAGAQDMPGMNHNGHHPAHQPSGEADFYSEMAAVNMKMHAGMDVAPTNDVDQDFIRMMVPHHQGAVDMALVYLKYGHDERLRRVAQSIIVEQGQEIAYLRSLAGTPPMPPAETSAPQNPQSQNPQSQNLHPGDRP